MRALYLVLAVAAALRLYPVWFGLPYLHTRPDEVAAVGYAASILRGDLNPHFFHWPSLTFYVFAALFKIAAFVGALVASGRPLTIAEMILIGRIAVAVAGTATVAVLFRMTRRIAGDGPALLAAAFLTVAILHVRESHFAMSDTLMTLLVTASLAALVGAVLEAAETPGDADVALRGFAIAGLFGGLAVATKYSAAAILCAMAAAQLLLLGRKGRPRWAVRTWMPLVVFVAVCAAAFVAGTPYSVLDAATFVADLRYDATHLAGGHGVTQSRGWSAHLVRSLPYGAGMPVALAALAGIVPLVRRRPDAALVLGSFAVALYAVLGSGYTVFFRYVLPLMPIACLLAAAGTWSAAAWLAIRTGMSRTTAAALLGFLIGVPALANSMWFDVLLARTDSRVLAARWLAPRLDAGDTVYDSGGQYTTLDLGNTAHHPWRFDEPSGGFGDPLGRTPDWLVLQSSPVSLYASTPAAVRRLAAERYESRLRRAGDARERCVRRLRPAGRLLPAALAARDGSPPRPDDSHLPAASRSPSAARLT